ncbi:PR domain containing 8 [Mus musculus]|nr:PR domain containing 8 [Mus musculus]
MEDSGIQRGIWDGDAKAVQQCLTDIFTSVYTTCDIPENAIFGPCVLSHTSLYDSIAFVALKSTDKRTVPYIFRVDTSAANGSSEGLMWLRLVQSARDKEEQNLEAYIKNGQLFYRSLRRIAKDEELLVWYGKELTELLLLCPSRAHKMNGLHLGVAAGRRWRRGDRGDCGGLGGRPNGRIGRAEERLLAARALLLAAVPVGPRPEAGRSRAVSPGRRRGSHQTLPGRRRSAGCEAAGGSGPERSLRAPGERRWRWLAQAEPLPLRHRLLAQELGCGGSGGGGRRRAPAAATALRAHPAAALLHFAVSARAELVRQMQRLLPHDLRPGVPYAVSPQKGVCHGAPGEAAAGGETQVPHLQRVLQGASPPVPAHDLA